MKSAGWPSLAALFAAAGAGGAAFALAGVPIAWILGSVVGAAVFANIVGAAARTRPARRAGQLILGTSAAAVLTPEVLEAVVRLLPFMLGAALLAIGAGVAAARPFAAVARVDRTTALLSTLPAGLAEMAGLAQECGARADVVTLTHTLRVFAMVTLLPLSVAATATAVPLVGEGPAGPGLLGLLSILACGGMGAAVSLAAGWMGMLNPWIVAPMIVGAALAALDLPVARMPHFRAKPGRLGPSLCLLSLTGVKQSPVRHNAPEGDADMRPAHGPAEPKTSPEGSETYTAREAQPEVVRARVGPTMPARLAAG